MKAPQHTSLPTATLADMEDELVGKLGTPDRDAYEAEVAAAIIGETIRALRKRRGWTQAELGARLGVKKSNISKMEKSGTTMTLETAVKAFAALGATMQLHVTEGNIPV